MYRCNNLLHGAKKVHCLFLELKVYTFFARATSDPFGIWVTGPEGHAQVAKILKTTDIIIVSPLLCPRNNLATAHEAGAFKSWPTGLVHPGSYIQLTSDMSTHLIFACKLICLLSLYTHEGVCVYFVKEKW